MARKNTRDLLLNVAATLFATTGFRHVTMESIATAAGRGRRTVYLYFHDKIEIYNLVVEKEITEIISSLRVIIRSETGLQQTLAAYAQQRISSVTALLDRNQLLARDYRMNHSRVERQREKLNEAEIVILTPLFDRFREEGLLRTDAAPADLAAAFLNLIRGNDKMLIRVQQREEAVRKTMLACDIFSSGIIQRPGDNHSVKQQ